MSDTVKVTVITGQNQIELSMPEEEKHSNKSIVVTHPTGETLMSTLLNEKLIDGSFCGGRGDCGRCVVQFVSGATLPTGIERSVMEPEELRSGYRLACMARPKQDCIIRLALHFSEETDIITYADLMIELSEKIDYIGQNNAASVASQRLKSKTEGVEEAASCIMAVDLGTTTIAMQLVETASGRIVDTCVRMNPQRRFGADVLSRIQAAISGYAQELKDCLWQVLEEGLNQFMQTLLQSGRQTESGPEPGRTNVSSDISLISIAGNTTMEHLLMGLPTVSLGQSPFTPVNIGLQKTEWRGIPVYVLPGISTFVGGDIVAGLYACGMLENGRVCTDRPDSLEKSCNRNHSEKPESMTLLIDLGTNGEMVLQKGDRMLAAATAAGPAFEGGVGNAVIGSDMVAIADALLSQGIMDESGLLKEPYFTEGVSIKKKFTFTPGKDKQSLYMAKEDIRSLQMAKAAVRTGIELLTKRLYYDEKRDRRKEKTDAGQQIGRAETEAMQIYLAGGFGYYLNVDAAVRTGLLPKSMQGRIRAVGNTSLAGAYLLGKALWLGMLEEETLHKKLAQIESINLANQEGFDRHYISNMNFEMK